ncbi:DUF2796 domain-containing protein [Denitromonas halophila]|uniref:DUF2796 domain-containing protein n=2 Tax=Denitromonas halophila TaxID=1629404 RepID=A0A557R1W6_9RHOO|nr:DUF2796 domain-containing protein [Denitromonas halophila]
MKTRHVVGGLCLLAVPFLAAAAGGAHEHGVARLSLVQEGTTITLGFESPLDSLVGFEHAPRTDAQKQALQKARAALENAATAVTLPAAAACVVSAVTVDMPFGDTAHDGHDDHDTHADAEAEYVFECAQPAALDTVTIGLFQAFPRLQRIDAEAATAAGQGKAVLRPAQATWSLPAAR